MKTREQALADLAQTHERARLETELKYNVLNRLPPDLLAAHDWSFYPFKLYDRIGTLKCNYQRYESIREGSNPTPQTIRELAEAFPVHVPVCTYRDSCVGIRTMEDAEAQKNKESATITPISPVWLRFDPAISQDVSVEWIAETDLGRIEMHVQFPLHGAGIVNIGHVRLNMRHDKRSGEPLEVLSNVLEVAQAVRVIGNAKAEVIRYASGSHKTAGSHLLFWDSCNGEHAGVTPHTIADVMDGCAV